MRHYKKGRKLGTDASHTKAMKRSLVANLFIYDRIKTTLERAKEIRGDVDRVVTWAKRGDVHSRRLAIAKLGDKNLVAEIFSKVEQGMFEGRPGGYSRILRVGTRRGDSATIVIMELVQEPVAKKGDKGAGAAAGEAGSEKAAAKRPFGKKGADGTAKDEDAVVDEDAAEVADAADEAADVEEVADAGEAADADADKAAVEVADAADAADEAAADADAADEAADVEEVADASEAADEVADAAEPVEETDADESATGSPEDTPTEDTPAEDTPTAPTPEDSTEEAKADE
jgi:large subunit ribosomal protein L17